MDQLPLDGRLTDLGGFARLGAEGVDLLLADSTNAEVPGFVTPEREHRPGARRGDPRRPARRVIVACFASHVHRVQQVLDAAADARPQGRLRRPLDGAQHGRGPRPRPAARPARADGRPGRGGRDAAGPGGAGLHRLPGRAAVGAGPDGQPRPPAGPDRARRHRDPRVVAGAGQRDRRLPGDQRAGPGGRHRRAQGRRDGARVRARPGRRAALPAQRGASRATCCRCTASGGTCGRTAGWPRRPGCRPTGWCWPTTASWSTWSTASPRITGKVDCGYVYVDGLAVGDVGEESLKDRRILGDEGFIAITVVVDSVDRQGHRRGR